MYQPGRPPLIGLAPGTGRQRAQLSKGSCTSPGRQRDPAQLARTGTPSEGKGTVLQAGFGLCVPRSHRIGDVAGATTDLLEQVPQFSDLEHKELEQIAGSMKKRTFAAGDIVTAEGQQGVGFFVIESGIATVSVGGKELRTLKPGDHFGEIAL